MKIAFSILAVIAMLAGCTSSGGADSGAPPTCDGGKCTCSGASCTCPTGTGYELQCYGACTIQCMGPCVVHCQGGPCDVKCGGSMPGMCAHDNLVCNQNCPP